MVRIVVEEKMLRPDQEVRDLEMIEFLSEYEEVARRRRELDERRAALRSVRKDV